MMEQLSATAPTKYPILLLLFEFALSCLQRGHMQECKLPVQRLVIPAGVESSPTWRSNSLLLSTETATYDCFSSSYLSISGIRGCDIDGDGRALLLSAGSVVSNNLC